MGAQEFEQLGWGRTAREAFGAARDQAFYEHGHRGYTGSLAEKPDFVVVGRAPDRKSAFEMARKMMDDRDERIDDKWGPAGCIAIVPPVGAGTKAGDLGSPPEFLFFGWASS